MEKYFLGIDLATLDKKKKYYVEVDGYGKVFVEEVLIPLPQLQSRIFALEEQVAELNEAISRDENAKKYNVKSVLGYDIEDQRPTMSYDIGGVSDES